MTIKFKELREKYKGKYPPEMVAAAVKIALDMAGAMTPATKKIEAIRKGLSNDPVVRDTLRMANENVNEVTEANLQELSPETLDRYMTKAAQDKKDFKKKSRAYKTLGDTDMAKKLDKKSKNREVGFRKALIRHKGKTHGNIPGVQPNSPVAKALAKMPKSLLKKYGLDVAHTEHQGEEIQEANFMLTVPKGGPGGKDLNVKVMGKDKNDAVAQWRKKNRKYKNDEVIIKAL